MKEQIQKGWLYLSRHWFKIGVVALLLYAFFSKDLSFRVELRAPEDQNMPLREEQAQPEPAVRRSTLTENGLAQRVRNVTDRSRLFGKWWNRNDDDLPLVRQLSQHPREEIDAFLHRFIPVAQGEQRKFGIPASVILANALLMSQSGKADAAAKGNNFFALVCTPDWQGETLRAEGRCFRLYENAWLSFRDHSLYLTTGALAHLSQLRGASYASWTEALEEAGFNQQTQDLARQLNRVIEKYELQAYD